jgi:hypothetical protein
MHPAAANASVSFVLNIGLNEFAYSTKFLPLGGLVFADGEIGKQRGRLGRSRSASAETA